jgi:fucokinase / fucose-1-phosphate guanylyltransferase
MSMSERAKLNQWDVLIVTASNEAQAQAYESQLNIRSRLGLIGNVREVIVVPDPGGKRIGSGGSTLYCLMEVLDRRLASRRGSRAADPDAWENILRNLRILIVHAGGDSRRLPAYGPCGKIFVPVPCESDAAVPMSLFDRQLPTYLALPELAANVGQVVITSGDALLRFEPAEAQFAAEGVTGLACYATLDQASQHGVFCKGRADQVKLYLQKPSVAELTQKGAIDAYGQACLDIGVMNFDAKTAVKLLQFFGARPGRDSKLVLSGRMGRAVIEWGLDFYREICCAMGHDASESQHQKSALQSGSKWSKALLRKLFRAFSTVPFSMKLLKYCDFLDFGTSRAIITSGTRLLQEDRGASHLQTFLDINNEILDGGVVKGVSSWVEGCCISSALTLGGENVVVGVDVDEPISLPPKACLDVIKGKSSAGKSIWFVRCYSVEDTFKRTGQDGGSFCGLDMLEWLKAVGAGPQDVWDASLPLDQRSIWNARMFPAARTHGVYKRWLWMLDPAGASAAQARAWRKADRYSLEQILMLADHRDFCRRRSRIRASLIRQSLRQMFRPQSGFSSPELAYLLSRAEDLSAWVSEILSEAHQHFRNSVGGDTRSLVLPRILHTLGSALTEIYQHANPSLSSVMPGLKRRLGPAQHAWLRSLGLDLKPGGSILRWARRAQSVAFENMENAIVAGGLRQDRRPRSTLRSDEIVWARSPARLDMGGGWTDTPPYSLEHGGCVVNAAVNLNGQPPIQAYARIIDKPVIRVSSIDQGARTEITRFEELLDYRKATSSFALAKAALAMSCFQLQMDADARNASLKRSLERFGGGIELTTLAAIPKGSGLGTSSIMGAVLLAAIQRAVGTEPSQQELFYSVLRLEQALTTGGGWQDQIGGAISGVKMIVTEPGFVPDARIHYVVPDILDPKTNGGLSLLYYTGLTRLAKNILHQVVARYLNRGRATMATLRQIRIVAAHVADALVRKDIATFGHLIDVAWQLNKQLDPNSSTEQIESLFERVRPFVYGAKLLGAGGGGFMLMVCKSGRDARSLQEMLEAHPPNDRARFCEFDVSNEGLTVTVS